MTLQLHSNLNSMEIRAPIFAVVLKRSYLFVLLLLLILLERENLGEGAGVVKKIYSLYFHS